MKHLLLKTIAAVVLILKVNLAAQVENLPRSTPEAQGVFSSEILEFIETADQKVNSMHSFMLLRHGLVVAEAWWKPESNSKQHVFMVAQQKLHVDGGWAGSGRKKAKYR